MGQSAEEVRRDIERTRMQMGTTIDEIGDRVSPRRMVERRTDRVKTAFRGAREHVMGSAEYGMDTTGWSVSPTAGVAAVGEGVAHAAGTAVDTLASAPEIARRQTAGNPLAAGLIAFGGGVLLASLLPKTPVEQQMASRVAPALEPMVGEAKEAGQQVANQLKEVAADAAGKVTDQASLAAQEVKEQAAEASRDVAQQAAAVGDEVKRSASTGTAGGPGSATGLRSP